MRAAVQHRYGPPSVLESSVVGRGVRLEHRRNARGVRPRPGGEPRVRACILDNVEARALAVVRRALTPTGILIPNSGRGGRWLGPLGRIVKARVLSGFTRQQLKPFTSVAKRQDLLTLADLLTTGQVTSVIDRTYPSTKQPTPSATSRPATPEEKS